MIMYNPKIELGKRLKGLRGSKAIEDVSEDTGVPLDYLLRLEDGSKIINPSVNALYKLADYYKCELKELLMLGGIIVKKKQVKRK